MVLDLLLSGITPICGDSSTCSDGNEDANGGIGGTHRGCFKQGAEGFLVNTGGNQLEELVVPGLLFGVLLMGSPGQDIAWSCEEGKLRSRFCLAEHDYMSD